MSSNLRVLHLVHTPGPGGTEAVVQNVVKWSVGSSVSSAVAAPPGRLEEAIRSSSAAFYEAPFTTVRRSGGFRAALPSAISAPRLIRTIRGIVDDFNPDIIHSHAVKTTLMARAALHGRNHPVLLWHLHDFIPLGRFRTALIRMAANGADAIAAVSEDVASIVRGIADVKVIHNAIELPEMNPSARENYRRSLDIPDDAFVFGYAGRLDPEKGIDLLLKAFAEAAPKLLDARLLLAGDSPFRGRSARDFWEAQVSRKNLGHHVRFLGRLADLDPFYHALDCFILPSPREPFGLVILEALACGVPIIACDSGGPREILAEFSGAILVPPENSAAMADAIAKIRANSEYARTAEQTGRSLVEKRFTPPIQMKKLADLYEVMRH